MAETERSFSKLGNSPKTWLRSTTGQGRLNLLALSWIENAMASTMNFDDVINKFAVLKVRKKIFYYQYNICIP